MTQRAQANTRPKFCRSKNASAFPDRGRLRNGSKRRRRRRPEVVAHSTSFTPIKVLQRAPRAFATVHLRRQDPPVRGREPTASDPRRGSVLARLAHAVVALLPSPSNPRISLPLYLFVILYTESGHPDSIYTRGITFVLLILWHLDHLDHCESQLDHCDPFVRGVIPFSRSPCQA